MRGYGRTTDSVKTVDQFAEAGNMVKNEAVGLTVARPTAKPRERTGHSRPGIKPSANRVGGWGAVVDHCLETSRSVFTDASFHACNSGTYSRPDDTHSLTDAEVMDKILAKFAWLPA
jgi:hypothetical protein